MNRMFESFSFRAKVQAAFVSLVLLTVLIAAVGIFLGKTGIAQAWPVLLALLVLGGAAAVGLAAWVTGESDKPLEALGRKVEAFTSGDKTVDFTGGSEDALGAVEEVIGRMTAHFQANELKIGEVVGEAHEILNRLSSAVDEISSSAVQMTSGAEEQNEQASRIAAAIEELSRIVIEVAQNADNAAESAKQATERAHESGKVVDQTVDRMGMIASAVTDVAQTIEELGQRAEEIGEIVRVVDDIADQTNLLALNAAIEAAKAGESGRGFAVVADEVRKLAEKTSEANKEVVKTIKAIQEGTRKAVSSMESGVKEVEEGTWLANQAGESLREIVDGFNQITDMVVLIATAASQQSSAAEEISRTIESISSITQQMSSGAELGVGATQELAAVSSSLSEVIGRLQSP